MRADREDSTQDWESKSMPNTYDVTAASPVRESATHEDFQTIFNEGIKELYQLAGARKGRANPSKWPRGLCHRESRFS